MDTSSRLVLESIQSKRTDGSAYLLMIPVLQSAVWVLGTKLRSKFRSTYLVNRTVDFARSFDTSRWFIGIRGDTDDKSSRWRLLVGGMGVDRLGIG